MKNIPASLVVRAIVCAWAAIGLALACQARDIVREPFLGVKHTTRIDDSIRPLFINILEIDLTTPGRAHRPFPQV